MSNLPVIPKKYFTVKSKFLPKTGIELSPFNVGLEDILLQVKDGTNEEKVGAIKQIIQACIRNNKDIDVGNMPIFLLEYIFLKLRQHSSGEIIEQQYQCKNEIGGVVCDHKMPISIDLRDFVIKEYEGHKTTLVVSDPIGVKFKYPTINILEDIGFEQDEKTIILSCIDSIFNEESVFAASEHTFEELKEFWSQFTIQQKEDVFNNYFAKIPHIHYEKKLKCEKCGFEHDIEFRSLKDVFQ